MIPQEILDKAIEETEHKVLSSQFIIHGAGLMTGAIRKSEHPGCYEAVLVLPGQGRPIELPMLISHTAILGIGNHLEEEPRSSIVTPGSRH